MKETAQKDPAAQNLPVGAAAIGVPAHNQSCCLHRMRCRIVRTASIYTTQINTGIDVEGSHF